MSDDQWDLTPEELLIDDLDNLFETLCEIRRQLTRRIAQIDDVLAALTAGPT